MFRSAITFAFLALLAAPVVPASAGDVIPPVSRTVSITERGIETTRCTIAIRLDAPAWGQIRGQYGASCTKGKFGAVLSLYRDSLATNAFPYWTVPAPFLIQSFPFWWGARGTRWRACMTYSSGGGDKPWNMGVEILCTPQWTVPV